ncbi:threonine-phosphate decarboxylase [Rhizorhapis suberifaciens]|uniref:Cobalamin biosynthetic protein CobC n=1 Tax=Rhizorhapis suberifaciens TaxID=13656 RepID=A0A840HR81_9SPHN|nr:threonine-phosphate decarboxylase [Rhizorhapis suberifaciens]MBB4640120.1 cobalamin biosynthetic protein CobC [Rhizorhapis suberifaciens]
MTRTATPYPYPAELIGHGGRVGVAARHFPAAPSPWMDLSTGVSPWWYPYDNQSQTDQKALPDPEALLRLEAAAGLAFGTSDAAEVVAVPGSDIAIRLLPFILGAQKVRYLAPIYSGHRAAWPNSIPVTPGEAQDSDLLVLCNPNNPDGRIIPPDELRALPCQLIVDEAFADALPECSLAPDRRGAILLRSFGKFFGLAGVRLGFVLADPPLARRLRAVVGDWPVSSAAIAIGTAAYQDLGWHREQRQRLNDASQRLHKLLRRAGLEIVGGTPLFRLARTTDAACLFRHLAQAGILTRPFSDDPSALRFGLPGEEAQWQRLEQALTHWSTA